MREKRPPHTQDRQSFISAASGGNANQTLKVSQTFRVSLACGLRQAQREGYHRVERKHETGSPARTASLALAGPADVRYPLLINSLTIPCISLTLRSLAD